MKPSPVVPAICAASVASLLSISAYMNTQLPRAISGKPVPAASASQQHAPGTRTTGTRTTGTKTGAGTGQHRTPPAKPPAKPGTGTGNNGGGYGGYGG